MIKPLLALVILGLTACVPPKNITTAQANTLPKIENSTTALLEAKIERLESSIEFLIQDRKEQINQAQRYRSCASKCTELSDKITDDYQKQTTKEENQEIRKCWKECEKDQPLEVIGC